MLAFVPTPSPAPAVAYSPASVEVSARVLSFVVGSADSGLVPVHKALESASAPESTHKATPKPVLISVLMSVLVPTCMSVLVSVLMSVLVPACVSVLMSTCVPMLVLVFMPVHCQCVYQCVCLCMCLCVCLSRWKLNLSKARC
jgi:hypothetical protein